MRDSRSERSRADRKQLSVCLFNSEHRLGDWNEALPERASTYHGIVFPDSDTILILEEVPNLEEVLVVPKLQI